MDEVPVRPLYAYVAVHNVGSMRVLERCGFWRNRVQEAIQPAPEYDVEELSFVLNA